MPIDMRMIPLPAAGDRTKRIAAAKARRDAKNEYDTHPATIAKDNERFHYYTERDLQHALSEAKNHKEKLSLRLSDLQGTMARMKVEAIRFGSLPENFQNTKTNIILLPEAIEAAEVAIQEAASRLKDHQDSAPKPQPITIAPPPKPRRPRNAR